MIKFFKKIQESYPKSRVVDDKNYVSFSLGGAFVYELRIQQDVIRLLASNYPAKASFGESFKIIKQYKIEGKSINGNKIIFEAGVRNADKFTLRIEIPYKKSYLTSDDFIDTVIDSCEKFHNVLLPLVSHFQKEPLGSLSEIMGEAKPAKKNNTGSSKKTIQGKIADAVCKKYKDAIVKKIDTDNYLDIHIPSINEKKGTHLGVNTAKDVIRMVFYCRDADFVKNVLNTSDEIEEYSNGIRPSGNPSFTDVDEAVKAIFDFLNEIQQSDSSEHEVEDDDDEDIQSDLRSMVEKLKERLIGKVEEEEEEEEEETDNEEEKEEEDDDDKNELNIDAPDLSFAVGKSYEKYFDRFLEISQKTGIMTNDIIVQPTPSERDELWDITRAFAERIYKVDTKLESNINELNILCHFSIIALHWCDIYVTDERFSYLNGRFRRDTIALALCFYARIDRKYAFYDSIKSILIMPHIQYSVLLWTINSIVNIGHDNIFGMFSFEQAKKAQQLFLELNNKNQQKGIYGHVSPNEMPANHPLQAIWSELYLLFNNVRIPFQFIKSYISEDPPIRSFISKNPSSNQLNSGVNVTLLEIDQKENKEFLNQQIEHKQFPKDWGLFEDLALVYIYFANTTDGKLSDKEKDKILALLSEWSTEENQDTLNQLILDSFQKAQLEFNKDKSKERFAFALENLRRHFFIENDYSKTVTIEVLKVIISDISQIAESDNSGEDAEYKESELILFIKDEWGINNQDEEETEVEIDTDEDHSVEEDEELDLDAIIKGLELQIADVEDKNEEVETEEEDEDDEISLFDFDVSDDNTINYLCEKIKKGKYLTNLLYINQTLLEKGFEVDKHQSYFFDSSVLISDRELEGFLVVNMDGFYSNCMNEDEMNPIFSWSGVNDIEYEEDGASCSIDIIADQGRLTIKKIGSHSLKILHTFYKYVWETINSKFKDEPFIIWNDVWDMGIKEVGFKEYIDYFTFDISQDESSVEEEEDIEEETDEDFITDYFDEKISDFYCDNVWEREGYVLDKIPFPNVIQSKADLDLLIRKFTSDEVDLIVNKINKTKTYILLPFIKEILSRCMDLSSFKPPFWFIPVVAYGNNVSSILYFNQDGIYSTKNSASLSMVAKVDVWKSISVEPGYNDLFEDDSDDDMLSSLKIDWYNPNTGNSGATNIVEFHGVEYGASLKIILAIWNSAWKDVVDRSRGTSQFFLGPPPFVESFDSWEDLLKWAKKK